MELLCPHCMKKVTVGDDKAGQVLNCPLCQGVFAAPSLPPARCLFRCVGARAGIEKRET